MLTAMKKRYSIAIGLAAACCMMISAAVSRHFNEKEEMLGKSFSTASVVAKTTETPPNISVKKAASNQTFPSIDELVRAYRWKSYEYNSNYNGWVNRELWISRGEADNDLQLVFDNNWVVKATYNQNDGVISVESPQFIRHDDYNDIDVYFHHCRWNEDGERVFLDSPLTISVFDNDLLVDANDIIYIGKEDVGFFISADNNSFTDYNCPEGYSRVGNTKLFSRNFENIDIYGLFENTYYRSTFSDGGYKVSLQVNDGYACQMDCSSKQTLDGVDFYAKVEQQGEFARISYILQNNNDTDATISIGTHADVMIGDNDRAPITRRIDTLEQTYGLTMSNGNGAQLCVLFGAGLTGVTAVDDFWFGYYGTNSNPDNMVGNYYSGSDYMVENGSYDSGMGWCWKNRVIPAGETLTFSYLIGVGDVNLEPNFSFAVTPEDPEGWNNLSLPHQLTINGEYESPAGVDGRIEYAVEDSEEWIALTDMLPSGSEFEGSMTVMFDASKPIHSIKFRTVDNVGNTTMLKPIEYIDVKYIDYAGVEERTYNGNPQTLNITSQQLGEEEFTVAYLNNVNAGTASFRLEGVFPYSIGRSPYFDFTINPLALDGDITLKEDTFVFNNAALYPEWSFSNEVYSSLLRDQDYTVVYKNNFYPGTGSVEVSGCGNYIGSFSKEFTIDKAPLSESLYSVVLPEEDIVYDGNVHSATFTGAEGVGSPTFRYVDNSNGESLDSVAAAGKFDIYLRIADGDYYYGSEERQVGSFSIYNFDNQEWMILNAINTQLQAAGASETWNMANGITSVGSFEGLKIKEGHVVGINLSSQGLTGDFPLSILSLPKLKKIDVSGNDLSGDLPMTLMAIASQNPSALAPIDTLKINGNEFSGNLGILAHCLPSLTYLDASYNKFEEIYPEIPSSVKYLNIRGQQIERTIELNLSNIDIENLKTQIPSIILYDPKAYGFKNEVGVLMSTEALSEGATPSGEKWSLQLYIAGSNVMPTVVGSNTYKGRSGDTLYVYGMQDGELNGIRCNVKLSFDQGDANFFNGIDASDLQATILYAFGEYSTMPFNFTAANTYEDDVINVQDVACTVNILLSLMAQDVNNPSLRRIKSVQDDDVEARIILSGGKVILYSEKPIAALTLKASGDVEWIADRYGLTQSVAGSNMVAYSLAGAEIPSGATVIGEYSGNAEILSASLADSMALPVSVSVDLDAESGVDHLPFDIDDNCQIFDVTGLRHTSLVKGLNIIVRDGKTVRYFNTK